MDKQSLQNRNGIVKTLAEWEKDEVVTLNEIVVMGVPEESEVLEIEKPKRKKK